MDKSYKLGLVYEIRPDLAHSLLLLNLVNSWIGEVKPNERWGKHMLHFL